MGRLPGNFGYAHSSRPPTMTDTSGRSIIAPGPKVVITCPSRSSPSFIRSVLQQVQPHRRLHVAQAPMGAELALVAIERGQIGIKRLAQERWSTDFRSVLKS